jgi:hypothetical protein
MTKSVVTYIPDDIYARIIEAKKRYDSANQSPKESSLSSFALILISAGLAIEERKGRRQEKKMAESSSRS